MNTTTISSPATEALRKELETLQNRLRDEENKAREEQLAKIQGLPQYLGVSDLNQVVDLIKTNRNTKVYKSSRVVSVDVKTWGRGRKIPREVRDNVVDLLKSREFTTNEIAKKTGVSGAAVNKLKKQAGLVAA